MGLVQKREGIFGAVPWLLPGTYPGKGLPWPSLRCRGLGWRPGTSPWVWRGSEHVSSLTSLLISQHNAEGDGHQSRPDSEANAHPSTSLPSCCTGWEGTGHGTKEPSATDE